MFQDILVDGNSQMIVILAALWTIPWKGWALWRAAKTDQRWWFVAFLFINTLGVLEIIYIFVINKKRSEDVTPRV